MRGDETLAASSLRRRRGGADRRRGRMLVRDGWLAAGGRRRAGSARGRGARRDPRRRDRRRRGRARHRRAPRSRRTSSSSTPRRGCPPFRLCFATALPERVIAVLPIPPLPDVASLGPGFPAIGPFPAVATGTPGVFPGTIGALPTLEDLAPFAVTPFVVLASSLLSETQDAGPDGGAEETCDTLIGLHGLGPIDVPSPGRLVPGVDFWQLATIPVGAFADGQSYLLSVTGCLPQTIAGGAESDVALRRRGRRRRRRWVGRVRRRGTRRRGRPPRIDLRRGLRRRRERAAGDRPARHDRRSPTAGSASSSRTARARSRRRRRSRATPRRIRRRARG